MHIGICEDNPHDLNHLIHCINKYSTLPQQVSFQLFDNADKLLDYLTNPQNKNLTCLLMDINLPSISGMQAAYYVREHDEHLPIIFISSSPEFAVESYRIRAFDYLLKPFTEDAIATMLDNLNKHLTASKNSFFLLKTNTGLRRILFKELFYVEALGRDIIYTLGSGERIITRDTLTAASKLLYSNPHFIKPHRSYIVSLSAIEQLNRQELLMRDNKKIPLARGSYEEIKKCYIDFCFEGDWL